MKIGVLAVIPARMESSRFPGKPLALINGKPLIERMYAELSRAKLIDKVVVATDSDVIFRAVQKFGGEAVKTSKRHKTGSDRVAEAAEQLGGDIIINIQADNLGIKAREYDQVISAMKSDNEIQYATFAKKIESEVDLFDPNRVKLITDKNGDALWFSRYPIPYLQDAKEGTLKSFQFLYHVGIYFFRQASLKKFCSWKRTPVEIAESLEQMRILENREKIRVFTTKSEIISIDAREDLAKLKKIKFKK